MPRQSHSSKKGAKMLTIRKLMKMFPSLVIPSSISSSQFGISGITARMASEQKARETVPTIARTAQNRPPSGLKCRLSSFRPLRFMLLLRLLMLAYSIGGTNITG